MSRNLMFYYNGEALEIVNKFKYLSIMFTSCFFFFFFFFVFFFFFLLLKLKTHVLDRHKKQFLK